MILYEVDRAGIVNATYDGRRKQCEAAGRSDLSTGQMPRLQNLARILMAWVGSAR